MGKIFVSLYSKEDQKIIRKARKESKQGLYVDWNEVFDKMIPKARERYKRFNF